MAIPLTEVVIHGWDVARASGQDYAIDPTSIAAALPHVAATASSR
jgi:hypothetical protein